ncbi:MAG TPA: TolC family protein, partial [Fimbriimonadaceae bacterium]|nr:TolC family protein [Fimbriimonadaceae bacterium]
MNPLAGAAIALAILGQQTQVGVRKLTLEDAVRLAETNAFGVRIAQTNVERSRQRVAEARGALGPRVNGQLQYTRFGQQGSTSFGGLTFVTSPIDSTQAQISLALPFDITGTTRKAINAASLQYQAQQELLEAQVNDVRLNVKRAYFGVLQAQAQLGVSREAVQRAEERLRISQEQFRAGAVARVDVLRFETQLAQARNDMITAQNGLQLARNNLNNVLGIPIETDVEVAEVAETPALERDPEQLVGEAFQNRPELRAQELVIEAFTNLRQSEERGMNPSLALSAVQSRNLG